MKTKISLYIVLLLVAAAGLAWSQVIPEPQPAPIEQEEDSDSQSHASIALSNPDYPATPGDVYVLGYSFRGDPVFSLMTLSPDYELDLGIFGTIDARGLKYLTLKKQVEEAINNRYPGSHPTFILERAGEFAVNAFLEGRGSVSMVLWGMIRLGDVIEDLDLDENYSVRRIRIVGSDGNSEFIDYYRYLYGRDEASNPLIRPGDSINFRYSGTLIEISGEVMEPGTKELLPSDSGEDVLTYVGGFRPDADLARIQKRLVVEGRERYSLHDWQDETLFTGESHLIRIHVPKNAESREVMYVEFNSGPAPEPTSASEDVVPEVSNGEFSRIILPIFEGMLVSDVLAEIEEELTPMADLRQCHIVRVGMEEPIPVNLEAVANDTRSSSNVALKPGDILGIPMRTIFVTVSGGVYEPGRYYFTPMRTADYYITLAGGIDPDQNHHRTVAIYDQFGNAKNEDTFIEPGDSVVVVQDNLSYQLNQKFTAFTVGLTFVTTLALLITTIVAGF